LNLVLGLVSGAEELEILKSRLVLSFANLPVALLWACCHLVREKPSWSCFGFRPFRFRRIERERSAVTRRALPGLRRSLRSVMFTGCGGVINGAMTWF
jgi:hypothetical protein